MTLNIENNRQAKKYTSKELVLRILWGVFKLFFRFSPRIFFKWRVFLLKLFGAKIGYAVHIYPSAIIYMPWNLEVGDFSAIGEDALIYNLGKIILGNKVTVSHRAHLCAGTHDYCDPSLPLIKQPILLQDNVWICANAFVGPNVTIGEGAVVGAAAVVAKNIDKWSVVAGNPAVFIKKRILKGSDQGET